eukprot:TRINITY_DN24042_c0_g1_i1.p1 TRINITY_DN24042_c0_g1~~TRINITY_DN24042_c0_g1_i1.p1  ORF type:complete len:847 (+),score=100.03 TRINITY_DN24042_c0_g1_i1:44-2542(+)
MAANPGFREKMRDVGKEVDQQEAKKPDLKQITDKKSLLVNLVGTFIIKEPKFSGGLDPTVELLTDCVTTIAESDPEFILKVAFYVRSKLYLRSTTNHVLSIALRTPPCMPFMDKWFNCCINLPSDLLEVVELLRAKNDGKLPPYFRRFFNSKFKEFNLYQFGKYNNAGKIKRKRKKDNKLGNEAKNRYEGNEPMTLKQLIRVCHTEQPADVVMAILGKRYPLDEESFKKTGLSGTFDPNRAGERMKIPVPVTWETELSAKGNYAGTWEHLIDSKNMPFMAMLRNLRNYCESGISDEHHKKIQERLQDEGQVMGSKQLPFRFLSAFEAIDFNQETLEKLAAAAQSEEDYVLKAYKFQNAEGKLAVRKKKKPKPKTTPTAELLATYKSCLEDAIRISVTNNLPPLRGSTAVFLDCSGSMDTSLTPPRIKADPSNLHEDSTGKELRAGEDFDLDDFFSSSGRECSNVIELSLIWKESEKQSHVDLDLSCMLLDTEGKSVGHCSYYHLNDKGLTHSGDITSAPEGAEEVIRVELDEVSESTAAVYCTVNSYSGESFNSMDISAFALRDASINQEEIAVFPLNGTMNRQLVAGAIVRKPGTERTDPKTGKTTSSWVFRVVNDGIKGHHNTLHSLESIIRENYLMFAKDWKLPGRTLLDMGMLFGLCTKYMSEECTLYGFGAVTKCLDKLVKEDTILPNIKKLRDYINREIPRGTHAPVEQVEELMRKKTTFDTIIILTDTIIPNAKEFNSVMKRYRNNVNKDVLIVTIDLVGTTKTLGVTSDKKKDLHFSGFSDQYLRYIAGYGQDQLSDIEALEPVGKKNQVKKGKTPQETTKKGE